MMFLDGPTEKPPIVSAIVNSREHSNVISTTRDAPSARIDWATLSPVDRNSVDNYLHMRLASCSLKARTELHRTTARIAEDIADFEAQFKKLVKAYAPGSMMMAPFPEIASVHEDVVAFARLLSSIVNDDSRPLEAGFTSSNQLFDMLSAAWCKRFDLASSIIEEWRPEFIARRFPIYRFVSVLLETPKAFKHRDLDVLMHRYPYKAGAVAQTQAEIAARHGISTSRAFQIAKRVPDRLTSLVRLLAIPSDFADYAPLGEREKDLIIIDEQVADDINRSEAVEFTPMFHAWVIAGLLAVTHVVARTDAKLPRHFLVHKDLSTTFDFGEFDRDLMAYMDEPTFEEMVLDLRVWILKKCRFRQYYLDERIRLVCAQIAYDCYGVACDESGRLVFEPNALGMRIERIAEILADVGAPMPVAKIFRMLESRYPGDFEDAKALRRELVRCDRFKRFYDAKMFGLKEWDAE